MIKKVLLSIIFLTTTSLISHSEEPPKIELEKFVNLVIEKLGTVPQGDAEGICAWVELLREINGAFANDRLREHLNSRFSGPGWEMPIRGLMRGFNPMREPHYDLEKLLNDPTHGEGVKNLLQEKGYLSKQWKEVREEVQGAVVEIPSFSSGNSSGKTFEGIQNGSKDQKGVTRQTPQNLGTMQGILEVVFQYQFECGEDDVAESISELKEGRLPGKRGFFTFANDTYADIFEKVKMAIDAAGQRLKLFAQQKDQKVTHKLVGEAMEIEARLFYDAVEPDIKEMDEKLKPFEEKNDDNWIRIRLRFTPVKPYEDPELKKQAEMEKRAEEERLLAERRALEEKLAYEKEPARLSEGERAVIRMLQQAKRWEEEWVALDGLDEMVANTKLNPLLKKELEQILKSETNDHVKRKVFLILAKDMVASFETVDESLIVPLFEKLTEEGYKVVLSSIPKVGKSFVLWIMKTKPHDSFYVLRAIEIFVEQNLDKMGDVVEVLKGHICRNNAEFIKIDKNCSVERSIICNENCALLPISSCPTHPIPGGQRGDDVAFLNRVIKQIQGSASSENYKQYLALRDSKHSCLVKLMVDTFVKFGKKSDVVYLLPLLDHPFQFIRTAADEAIQQIKGRN